LLPALVIFLWLSVCENRARIGKKFAFRKNLAISVAKRACQGMWIWQYRHNTLDAASIM
jgi:hypothetical protein